MTNLSNNGCAYLLNKSRGITSRKASFGVASHWRFKKYGHAGTLDPDAAGLLVVLMGKATRLSQYLISQRKTYRFTLVMGIETDTDDMTGKVLRNSSSEGITRDDIQKVLHKFTGSFKQRVPVYSAVRVNGVRSYKLARQGCTVESPIKDVWTENWHVGEIQSSTIELTVTVGTGTYVRALARDIGRALGTLGTADNIIRIQSGEFDLSEASKAPDNPDALLTMTEIMKGYPKKTLTRVEILDISHGRAIVSDDSASGTLILSDIEGRLIAIAESDGHSVKPVCVLV